ncbi:MAG: NAD(P)H-hydrate dehydratase [Niabella sp.]|nr:NAD(P)H-hydrate dehydratase [Niabella sp.]
MKLLNAEQIRQWDAFTIKNEPLSSLELMERAANACARWIVQNTLAESYYIFCGKGNNGGDGLALARLLYNANKKVSVYILESEAKGSEDYISNFNILHHLSAIPIYMVRGERELPEIPYNCIIIDALFGTGLNRPLTGLAAKTVGHINNSIAPAIAIDIPSGLFCDRSSGNNTIVKARHTLSFQVLKTAFLVAENEPWIGHVHIMDINLHPAFPDEVSTPFSIVNKSFATQVYRPRNAFAHKGNFGHALLIAGSLGKAGAAVLSTRACLRTGAGLVTTHVPRSALPILQTAIPEAMILPDKEEEQVSGFNYDPDRFAAIGVGPGIGTGIKQKFFLKELLEQIQIPLVLDADALNILAENTALLNLLNPDTILTPHPKEFTRLFGPAEDDFKRIEQARTKAMELNTFIVLKGHHTFIACPDGTGYFNITGNAGMAKGGSGDALTGMITGLLAQGYLPKEAALLGVFLHGLAGDLAAASCGMEALLASDLIDHIGSAFKQL